MKRRVGAVLVREKRVVSTGYNGTPRGVRNCSEGGCGRCNGWGDGLNLELELDGLVIEGGEMKRGQAVMGEGLDECLCLHAEENALLEAGRERVSGGGTTGAVLYCNTFVTSSHFTAYQTDIEVVTGVLVCGVRSRLSSAE